LEIDLVWGGLKLLEELVNNQRKKTFVQHNIGPLVELFTTPLSRRQMAYNRNAARPRPIPTMLTALPAAPFAVGLAEVDDVTAPVRVVVAEPEVEVEVVMEEEPEPVAAADPPVVVAVVEPLAEEADVDEEELADEVDDEETTLSTRVNC